MAEANEPVSESSQEDRSELERIIERFEQAWKRGEQPAIEEHLPSGEAERRGVLIELVHVDLECRLKAGETVRVETYLEHYPALAANRGVALDLIAREYELRRRQEPNLTLDEYAQRFPVYRDELTAHLETPTPYHTAPEPPKLTPATTSTDLPTIAGYEILGVLGKGGMGIVYRARQTRLNRMVALKVIRREYLEEPNALRRFFREAQVATLLWHPHIVRVYDAGQAGDTQFLAMEYVEGIDLQRLVKQSGPLLVPQACDYMRQAALGLQHVCERGLVHRDIKPSNLIVTPPPGVAAPPGEEQARAGPTGTWSFPAGVVKLLDMGLARLAPATVSTLTKAGELLGTPDYIAPEQWGDAHAADIRSDLYSLGCTFYYLLTGQPPFSGGTLMQKLEKHRWEVPVPVNRLRRDATPGVAKVVGKLMAKHPNDRYQTPIEAATILEPFCRVSPSLGSWR